MVSWRFRLGGVLGSGAGLVLGVEGGGMALLVGIVGGGGVGMGVVGCCAGTKVMGLGCGCPDRF